MTEQKMKLVPRQTAIGQIKNARYGDNIMDIIVYYGNFYAMPNGTVLHVPDQIYYQMLENFLKSPEGMKYEKPTAEEIKEAIKECVAMPSNPEPVYDPRPVVAEAKEEQVITEDVQEQETELKDISLEETLEPEEEQQEVIDEESEENAGEQQEEATLVACDSPEEKVKDDNNISDTEKDEINEEENKDSSEKPVETHEVPVSDEVSKKTNSNKTLIYVLTAVLGVSLIANGYLAALANKPVVQPQPIVDYKVLTLTKDIAPGEIITRDALQEVAISQEQLKAISGASVVTEQGKIETEFPVLAENISNVEGKLAVDNLKQGEYLLSGDYTALQEGVNSIAINVDGQEVLVPVEATVEGTSDVKMFAIITTKSSDGTISNKAINLGNITFQGKALTSVFDADGNQMEGQPTAEPTIEPTEAPVE